ncbi:hypothetical protein ACFXK0_26740 [Nocardia sp. NPDC059177]|uniref:hypothetical protein n=1 Tax=Nocardia sp. NPDC059177 TaxID=3346759 RepID=UPI0036AC31F9
MIADVPPGLDALYQRVQSSLSDLNTRTSRFRWYEFSEPTDIGPIDEELVAKIAADPKASAEMKELANSLSRGTVQWSAVTGGSYPLPLELRELVAIGIPFHYPPALDEQPARPVKRDTAHLYDDYDEDENQMPESWLE